MQRMLFLYDDILNPMNLLFTLRQRSIQGWFLKGIKEEKLLTTELIMQMLILLFWFSCIICFPPFVHHTVNLSYADVMRYMSSKDLDKWIGGLRWTFSISTCRSNGRQKSKSKVSFCCLLLACLLANNHLQQRWMHQTIAYFSTTKLSLTVLHNHPQQRSNR